MTERLTGTDLRRHRRAAGYTQETLAAAIGRTSTTIRNWEAERVTIPASALPLLLRVLGQDGAEQ